MILGKVQDNCYNGRSLLEVFQNIQASDLQPLLDIANIPITQLCHNSNLLIFPDSFESAKDEIENETVFNYYGGKIFTGNILGFIGKNDVSLQITSRFESGESNFLLHYMLQKAQGIYKEYQYNSHNDNHLRGIVDFARHFSKNIPFRGSIAYRTREFDFDNKVTQLIRHTIEFIKEKAWIKQILTVDKRIQTVVEEYISVTPQYNRFARQRILAANLRSFAHPYFSQYKNLIKLCLQILRHEQISYGKETDEIYGILFDGAWLWEEYLNTVLLNNGFIHPQNRLCKERVYLYEGSKGECYPDFYGKNMVMDAKYKGLDSEIKREDRFQLISYLHILNCEKGLFLYPSSKSESCYYEEGELMGLKGKIGAVPFHIPRSNTFQDFCDAMRSEEHAFLENINNGMTQEM